MITIKEVAQLAGVSTATITRYFNSPEKIHPKTYNKVKEVINSLNYTPNSLAGMLKSNKSNIVGLIVSDSSNIFFNKAIHDLNAVLTDISKQLIVQYSDQYTHIIETIKTFLSFRVEDILFMPNEYSKSVEKLLSNYSCYPLQLFVDYYPTIDSITIDDELGTYLATEELIKHNHERILLIDFDNKVHKNRRSGFIQAFKKYNITYSDDHVLALRHYDLQQNKAELANKIESFKPTAIISVTNNLTQFVVRLLRIRNIEIGQQISLIMYDDSAWAELERITVISQPIDLLIRQIQQVIQYAMTNEQRELRKLSVKPTLITRNSVKMLHKS